jgi:hypothetical protein
MSIPQRYIPKVLSNKDRILQKKKIIESRKQYKKGKYVKRPKVKTFHNKTSKYLMNVKRIYDIGQLKVDGTLVRKTKCSRKGLRKIINKGMGAYYSSGSRPNQTAESWGVARLGSAISGGPASMVDYHILEKECKNDSLALKMAKKTCRRANRCNLNKTKRR